MKKISWKAAVISLLAAVASAVALWLWHETMPFVIGSKFSDAGATVLPFVALLVAATLFSLTALFVKNRMLAYASTVAGVSMLFAFVPLTRAFALPILLALLLAVYAVSRIRRDTRLSLGFSVAKSLKSGLPLYFTVISLAVSLLYLNRLDEQRALEIFLPRNAFNYTLHILTTPNSPLGGLFAQYGELSPELTVNELLLQLLDKELASQGFSIAGVPQKELTRLIEAERAELARAYGITVRGEEKVGDVFYEAVTGKIENLFGPYRRYLPVASAIAFFLAFKTLTLVLYFVTLLVVFICVKILTRAKIVVHEKQKIEVDHLALDHELGAVPIEKSAESNPPITMRVPRFTGWNKMKPPPIDNQK